MPGAARGVHRAAPRGAATLLEQARDRGELPPGADLAVLVDMAYGFLWYRLLMRNAPLNADAARRLAACLIAAGHPAS